MTYGDTPAPSPDPWPPGNPEGLPFEQQGMSWDRDWTYRRVLAGANSSATGPTPGETSVINVGDGNDFDNGYLFYPLGSQQLEQQLSGPFAWRGGVNLTAYAEAEQRSFGFYHWFKANASATVSPFLGLNASQAGTVTGLSKMPYLRDSRRCAGGLDGFRIFYNNLSQPSPAAAGKTAVRWPDTVGIGQYYDADIHTMEKSVCPLPSYIIPGAPVLPYYLPFRAMTVDGVPNLLVAGKSMAMSFWANAAVRLHPEEWVSGVAVGVASALMARSGWTASDMLVHINVLQDALSGVGQPLEWTL